jgi:26S proteasome regulatory subunit N6
VVRKLSQMILDHRFFGILDQGRGHLIIYEPVDEETNFSKGVQIIKNMELVVDALYTRAKTLSVAKPTTA